MDVSPPEKRNPEEETGNFSVCLAQLGIESLHVCSVSDKLRIAVGTLLQLQ